MSGQMSLLDQAQHAGPYQKDSATSFEAAVAAGPRISPQKRRILAVMGFGAFASSGYTQDEMAIALQLPRSTVCARFNELERDGLIRKTDETRHSRYGRACAVYQLVRSRAEVGGASPTTASAGYGRSRTA